MSYKVKSIFAGGLALELFGAYLFFAQPNWRLSALSLALGAYMLLIALLNYMESGRQNERYGVSSLVSGARKAEKGSFRSVATSYVAVFLLLGAFLALLADPGNESKLMWILCLVLCSVFLAGFLDRRSAS